MRGVTDDDREPDIAETLAYMAEHPQLFTKKEMALMMKQGAEAIVTLRELVGIRADLDLEDLEPEGRA